MAWQGLSAKAWLLWERWSGGPQATAMLVLAHRWISLNDHLDCRPGYNFAPFATTNNRAVTVGKPDRLSSDLYWRLNSSCAR
jgi:hypothetical protein